MKIRVGIGVWATVRVGWGWVRVVDPGIELGLTVFVTSRRYHQTIRVRVRVES